MKKGISFFLLTFIFAVAFSTFPSLKQERVEFSVDFLYAAPADPDPTCPGCPPCTDCTAAQKAIQNANAIANQIFAKNAGSGALLQAQINDDFRKCREAFMDAIMGSYNKIKDALTSSFGDILGTIKDFAKDALKDLEDLIKKKFCKILEEVPKKLEDYWLERAKMELPYGLGQVSAKDGLQGSYVNIPWTVTTGKYGTLTTNSQNVSNSLTQGMIRGGSTAFSNAVSGKIPGLNP